MKVFVREVKTDKLILTWDNAGDDITIGDVKEKLFSQNKKIPVVQHSLRKDPNGKSLSDSRKLHEFGDSKNPISVSLFFRNLGPQVKWRTVFLVEYTCPLFIYLFIWMLRQPEIASNLNLTPITSNAYLRQVAMVCWVGHYVKRLLETIFIHRFSHATMPLRNLFTNTIYYGGFSGFVSYFINHPLYTPPVYGHNQILFGFFLFILGEFGNFSCHLALKRLRPAGSTIRRIPNPIPWWGLTRLFDLVACPNYTYETISWLGFSIMTQSLPALLFTIVGFYQMSKWALGKLKAYRNEFPQFPRSRRAIIPFIL